MVVLVRVDELEKKLEMLGIVVVKLNGGLGGFL
jgi:hypothetical protein